MNDIEADTATTSVGFTTTTTATNTLFGSTALFTAKRVFIAFLGIFLGIITMLPNGMMAASSVIAARIGLLASLSFGIGGLYGGYVNKFMWLLPGFALQVLALFFII
mmetsp:Transcript_12864/g.17223  ORF Transcript_12864/g.17223 Transcript_12864/m.17223 type:complete len:107 (+) Transcript_12864:126-446(+)